MTITIQIHHTYNESMDFRTYANSLIATERQIRKSLIYSGLDTTIQLRRVSEGSVFHDLQVVVSPILLGMQPILAQSINDFLVDRVKCFMSASYHSTFGAFKKADIKDGRAVTQHLSQNNGSISIIVTGDYNNISTLPPVSLSTSDAPQMSEELKKRERLLTDTLMEVFNNK